MAKLTSKTKNELTDIIVDVVYDESQFYRQEAKALTEDFLKKFGIFVGLYNKLNSTALSVENALYDNDIVAQFRIVSGLMQNNVKSPKTASTGIKRPKSTKLLSYEQFQLENGTRAEHSIYKLLKKQNQGLSRTEIAKKLSIRVSTVCGAISRMMEAGLVTVTGIKIDEETNRKVELLSWK